MKKSSRVLPLFLVFSLIVTLFIPTHSSADTSANTAQADQLKAAGLFQGTPTGYDLDSVLPRSQGLVLALRAQGMENAYNEQTVVEVAVTLGKVIDVEDIPGWARNPIAYALKQDPAITRGVKAFADGRVQFSPNEEMSGKQFITFMARAMGYDATLASSPDIAVSSGMLTPSQVVKYSSVARLTRGEAVDIMHSAVSSGVIAASGKKLIDKLVETGVTSTSSAIVFGYSVAPATPVPTPEPIYEPLRITSIFVPNCKQVQVTFNHDISQESLNASYFAVKDKGTLLKAVTPLVGPDKKVVTLTINDDDALTNGTFATVLVKKNVQDISGSMLSADYLGTDIEVMDRKIAEVVSVAAIGNKTILVTYDEPVWGGSSNSIDTDNYTVKNNNYLYNVMTAEANFGEKTVKLTLAASLTNGNCIVASNAQGRSETSVTDFAGYYSAPKEVTFNYVQETTPAVVTLQSVNRVTQKVVVKFSRPVYGKNVMLYQIASGIDAYGSYKLTKDASNAADTWEFTMKSTIPTGDVNFYLVNSTVLTEQLIDLYELKVPNQSFALSVAADKTPPTVKAFYLNENSSFDVVYNEEVDPNEANKVSNYEVKNSAGITQTITSTQLQVDQKTVRVFVALADAETYVFKVNLMKDIAGNTMAAPYSISKFIADSTNPNVTSAYVVPSTGKIYISFSEPMNTSELAIKANYLVDADGGTNNYQLLTETDSVTVPDNQHVVITMGSAITTPSVKMAAMRDLSGKKLGSDLSFEYTGLNNNLTNISAEAVALEKAELVGYDRIKLTFGTSMAQLGANDFLLRSDDTGTALTIPITLIGVVSSAKNSAGGSEIVVQLNKELNADGTYTDNGTVKAIEVQVQPSDTHSESGVLISARNHTTAITLQDKLGGKIATNGSNVQMITWNDFNGNLKIDTVVIKYNEAIKESTLSILTYSVEGYEITGVSIDSDGIAAAGSTGDHVVSSQYVVLNITKVGQANDIGSRPATTQVYPITDRLGNRIN